MNLTEFVSRLKVQALGNDALIISWAASVPQAASALTALASAGVEVALDDGPHEVYLDDDGCMSVGVEIAHNLVHLTIPAWGFSEGYDVWLDNDSHEAEGVQVHAALHDAIATGQVEAILNREDARVRRMEDSLMGLEL